jgi:hypothetical protein
LRTAQATTFAEALIVSAQLRELYASSNGDRWYLAYEPEAGHAFVRHIPNAPSGGQPSSIQLADFLRDDRRGSEHQVLMRLIGSLAEASQSG